MPLLPCTHHEKQRHVSQSFSDGQTMHGTSLLVEGEGSCDVRAAPATDPAQVESSDVFSEAALLAHLLQEVTRAQQPLSHICSK